MTETPRLTSDSDTQRQETAKPKPTKAPAEAVQPEKTPESGNQQDGESGATDSTETTDSGTAKQQEIEW